MQMVYNVFIVSDPCKQIYTGMAIPIADINLIKYRRSHAIRQALFWLLHICFKDGLILVKNIVHVLKII